jgi:hypothetical protein
LADYLAARPELGYVDPVNRLRGAAGATGGDLLLVAKGREGYYFGGPTRGVHGGLLPGESDPVLTFGYPGGDTESTTWLRETVNGVIADRRGNEGNRNASIADMVPVVLALLAWT